MSYIIDIILLVIFVLAVIFAAKRGIVLTALDLAAGIIAFLCAKLLSGHLATYVYSHFVKQKVLTYLTGVYGSIDAKITETADGISSAFGFLPKSILSYIESSGLIDSKTISSSVMSGVTTVNELETNVVSPVINGILNILCFVLIALLFMIVFRLLARLLSRFIKKSTVARTLDHTLGGVFGLLKGALYVIILAAVFNVASMLIPKFAVYTESSHICKLVSDIISF